MRYNSDIDMVEIFYNGVWNEWKSGELQKLIIYNYGSVVTPIELSGVYSQNSDNIILSNTQQTQNGGVLSSKDLIKVTRYNKLIIKGNFDLTTLASSNIRIGFVSANKTSDNASDFIGEYIDYVTVADPIKTEFILDTSEIIGEYYLRISGYRASITINQIYLL